MSDRSTPKPEQEGTTESASPSAPLIDYARVAAEFNYACNGGTGYGADAKTVESILNKYSRDDLLKIDEAFYQDFGKALANPGERWGLREELKDEFSGPQLKQYEDKLPKSPYAGSQSHSRDASDDGQTRS